MNTPVRRIGIAAMVMVLLLLANLTYVQVIKAGDYRGDKLNKRVKLDSNLRKRGQISADGIVLASSTEVNDALKYQRQYPGGAVYAPITGYLSQSFGSTGMEGAADDILNGSADVLFGRRFSDVISGRDPTGGNVVLTINPKVQQAAYDQLRGRPGAVVAIRPQTGEVLAMASTPSFDPTPLASHDADVQKTASTELNAASQTVLRHRAIAEIYPPGSTFKLVDTAAALSSGRFTPESQLTAASEITLTSTRTTLENYNGNACGTSPMVSLREALQRSCNTAFAQLVADPAFGGAKALRDQAAAFGIGNPDATKLLKLDVATSTLGTIPDTASLQQSSIGQRDVALTPLQNAMIVAAIANGGQVMEPYLIKEIQSQQLETIKTTEPVKFGRAVDAGVARTLNELMVNNENSYLAGANARGLGQIPGVQIAAKTGTAEHGADPKNTPPHVWYVAYAPAENPQIAVAVLVESGGDPNNLAATGGAVAGPIGRAVIAAGLGRGP